MENALFVLIRNTSLFRNLKYKSHYNFSARLQQISSPLHPSTNFIILVHFFTFICITRLDELSYEGRQSWCYCQATKGVRAWLSRQGTSNTCHMHLTRLDERGFLMINQDVDFVSLLEALCFLWGLKFSCWKACLMMTSTSFCPPRAHLKWQLVREATSLKGPNNAWPD